MIESIKYIIGRRILKNFIINPYSHSFVPNDTVITAPEIVESNLFDTPPTLKSSVQNHSSESKPSTPDSITSKLKQPVVEITNNYSDDLGLKNVNGQHEPEKPPPYLVNSPNNNSKNITPIPNVISKTITEIPSVISNGDCFAIQFKDSVLLALKLFILSKHDKTQNELPPENLVSDIQVNEKIHSENSLSLFSLQVSFDYFLRFSIRDVNSAAV
jgi:hypothetical protein